jgi:hypothetical protein
VNRTARRRLLRASAIVVGAYATTVAGAYVWRTISGMRYIDEAADADADADADANGEGDADADDEGEDELILDPRVLTWIRDLPCGVQIDAATGIVTAIEDAPFGSIHVVNVPVSADARTHAGVPTNMTENALTELVNSLVESFGAPVDVHRLGDDHVDTERLLTNVPDFARNDGDPAIAFAADPPRDDEVDDEAIAPTSREEHE